MMLSFFLYTIWWSPRRVGGLRLLLYDADCSGRTESEDLSNLALLIRSILFIRCHIQALLGQQHSSGRPSVLEQKEYLPDVLTIQQDLGSML